MLPSRPSRPRWSARRRAGRRHAGGLRRGPVPLLGATRLLPLAVPLPVDRHHGREARLRPGQVTRHPRGAPRSRGRCVYPRAHDAPHLPSRPPAARGRTASPANRHPLDRLYVYYGAAPAFWYQAPALGLADAALVAGRCHRADPRQYRGELDELRGASRAFVLVNHADPGELDDMLRYLDTIGTRVAEFRSRRATGISPGRTKLELSSTISPTRPGWARRAPAHFPCARSTPTLSFPARMAPFRCRNKERMTP